MSANKTSGDFTFARNMSEAVSLALEDELNELDSQILPATPNPIPPQNPSPPPIPDAPPHASSSSSQQDRTSTSTRPQSLVIGVTLDEEMNQILDQDLLSDLETQEEESINPLLPSRHRGHLYLGNYGGAGFGADAPAQSSQHLSIIGSRQTRQTSKPTSSNANANAKIGNINDDSLRMSIIPPGEDSTYLPPPIPSEDILEIPDSIPADLTTVNPAVMKSLFKHNPYAVTSKLSQIEITPDPLTGPLAIPGAPGSSTKIEMDPFTSPELLKLEPATQDILIARYKRAEQIQANSILWRKEGKNLLDEFSVYQALRTSNSTTRQFDVLSLAYILELWKSAHPDQSTYPSKLWKVCSSVYSGKFEPEKVRQPKPDPKETSEAIKRAIKMSKKAVHGSTYITLWEYFLILIFLIHASFAFFEYSESGQSHPVAVRIFELVFVLIYWADISHFTIRKLFKRKILKQTEKILPKNHIEDSTRRVWKFVFIVLVTLMTLDVVFSLLPLFSGSNLPSILSTVTSNTSSTTSWRFSRPFRLLLLILRISIVRYFFISALLSIAKILPYLVISSFLVLFYAAVSMNLFVGLSPPPQLGATPLAANNLNLRGTFDTFGTTTTGLFVMITGNDFPRLILEPIRTSWVSFFFFVIFALLSAILFAGMVGQIYITLQSRLQELSLLNRLRGERLSLTQSFIALDIRSSGSIPFSLIIEFLLKLFRELDLDPQILRELKIHQTDLFSGKSEESHVDILTFFELMDLILLRFKNKKRKRILWEQQRKSFRDKILPVGLKDWIYGAEEAEESSEIPESTTVNPPSESRMSNADYQAMIAAEPEWKRSIRSLWRGTKTCLGKTGDYIEDFFGWLSLSFFKLAESQASTWISNIILIINLIALSSLSVSRSPSTISSIYQIHFYCGLILFFWVVVIRLFGYEGIRNLWYENVWYRYDLILSLISFSCDVAALSISNGQFPPFSNENSIYLPDTGSQAALIRILWAFGTIRLLLLMRSTFGLRDTVLARLVGRILSLTPFWSLCCVFLAISYLYALVGIDMFQYAFLDAASNPSLLSTPSSILQSNPILARRAVIQDSPYPYFGSFGWACVTMSQLSFASEWSNILYTLQAGTDYSPEAITWFLGSFIMVGSSLILATALCLIIEIVRTETFFDGYHRRDMFLDILRPVLWPETRDPWYHRFWFHLRTPPDPERIARKQRQLSKREFQRRRRFYLKHLGQIILLQKLSRRYISRRKYVGLRQACRVLQPFIRGYLARKRFQKMLKQVRNRSYAIEEILETERRYVSDIQVIVDVFLVPLRSRIKANVAQSGKKSGGLFSSKSKDPARVSGPRPILTATQFRTIFSAIEVILDFNRQLLAKFELKIRQVNNRTKFGFIFTEMIPMMKGAYTTYVNNFEHTQKLMASLSNDEDFQGVIKVLESDPRCHKLSFESFLIMPVQRIPRYRMLLGEVLKNTWDFHPDYKDLQHAMTIVKEVATYINEAKRHAENLARLLEIQSIIKGYPDFSNDPAKAAFWSIVQPHRSCVTEGEVSIVLTTQAAEAAVAHAFSPPSPRSEQHSPHMVYTKKVQFTKRYLFLLSDVLMITKITRSLFSKIDTYTWVGTMPLHSAKAAFVPDSSTIKNAMALYVPPKTIDISTGTSLPPPAWAIAENPITHLIFIFETAAIRNKWLTSFTGLLETLQNK